MRSGNKEEPSILRIKSLSSDYGATIHLIETAQAIKGGPTALWHQRICFCM